jgi:hypothetical protein
VNRTLFRADNSDESIEAYAKEQGRPTAMKFATLGSALSVACIFTSGAVCGVMGMKLVAPAWLEPSTASAAQFSTASTQPAMAEKPASPAPATRPANAAVTASGAPKSNPFISRENELNQRALVNLLHTCRAQILLYKLQHGNKLPEFSRYPAWHPLTHRTRPDGTIASTGSAGPYLKSPPVNPLNGFGSIGLVRAEPKAGKVMPGEKLGFIFCTTTGKLLATARDGKTIFDDARAEMPSTFTALSDK